MRKGSLLWLGAGAVLLAVSFTAFGPRGLRNNNPGNLTWSGRDDWWNADPNSIWVGMVGLDVDHQGRRFIRFRSALDGLRALAINLLEHYSGLSANGIGLKWAPPLDNGGDSTYGAKLASQLDVDPNQVLDVKGWLPWLLPAITKNENTLQPYSQDLIAQAIGAAESATNTSGFHYVA